VKLDELYPYWQDAHDELLEAVSLLTDDQLGDKPQANTVSIRDILLDLVATERYWVTHLVAGNTYERPRADHHSDAASLVELLTATRQVTMRVLEPFSREGLRAVRHVPNDPQTNRPETNMPVAWLFWHVLEREIFAWGQVQLRLSDARRRR
jgi:uncharacterized damage-inducible protein DinB